MKEALFYIIIIFIAIIIHDYLDENTWTINFIALFIIVVSFLYRKRELSKYEEELIEKINGNIRYRKELKK